MLVVVNVMTGNTPVAVCLGQLGVQLNGLGEVGYGPLIVTFCLMGIASLTVGVCQLSLIAPTLILPFR